MSLVASRPLQNLPSVAALSALRSALADFHISKLSLSSLSATQRRHASHQAQTRANGPKNRPGRRMGLKKGNGEYVIPGNILFKQRGTEWFPGDNCYKGRSHWIHAGAPGYVRYYRDPARHPKRKYIGIVFEKDQTLPQAPHAVRRRKLGMLAYQMPMVVPDQGAADLNAVTTSIPTAFSEALTPPAESRELPRETRKEQAMKNRGRVQENASALRPGYAYRQANWEIGRAAERAGTAQKVTPFDRSDRFLAWQKRSVRKARIAEKKAMGRASKKPKKAKGKR